MKKIAVPTEGNEFASHFGRCPQYTIFKTEASKVVDKKVIPNPGHEPGYLPRYLKERGVDCVLAGGMGRRAQNIFNENDIEVVTGAAGDVDEGIKLYLEDELNPGENDCNH